MAHVKFINIDPTDDRGREHVFVGGSYDGERVKIFIPGDVEVVRVLDRKTGEEEEYHPMCFGRTGCWLRHGDLVHSAATQMLVDGYKRG